MLDDRRKTTERDRKETQEGIPLKIRVCTVIVTFNNAAMLKNLIDDLHSQIQLPDEIIIVDNASTDHTEALVTQNYPHVRYVKLPENLGSAGGYHEGIRRAVESGDFIYTLDDDVRLNPSSLCEILKGFECLAKYSGQKIGAVRSVGEKHPYRVPTRLAIFPWRGTLLKTSIIREAGLPSPDYYVYGEDLEYSLRLQRRGYRFYWIPTSVCQEQHRPHDGKAYGGVGKSVRYRSPFRLYYAFRNEVYIYLKYGCILRLLHTLMYSLKVTVLIVLSERLQGSQSDLAVINGIRDGFRGKMIKNEDYTAVRHD